MRLRLAPSAKRMAISRCRLAPRASSKFATLTHAINSTNATAPSSTHIAVRTLPTKKSSKGSKRKRHVVLDSG